MIVVYNHAWGMDEGLTVVRARGDGDERSGECGDEDQCWFGCEGRWMMNATRVEEIDSVESILVPHRSHQSQKLGESLRARNSPLISTTLSIHPSLPSHISHLPLSLPLLLTRLPAIPAAFALLTVSLAPSHVFMKKYMLAPVLPLSRGQPSAHHIYAVGA